jgi:centrosomal protein CEP290
MEEEKKKLQSDLREAKLKISSERWKLQSRSTDDEAHKATISRKNGEIAAYIEDIQRLSTENKALTTELEEIQAELEAAMGQLESYEEELETLRSITTHSEDKINGLVDERDQLRIKLEDLSFQIDGKQDIHDKHIHEMEKKISKLRTKADKIEADKQEQIVHINTLNETIQRLRKDDDQVTSEELRKELNVKEALIKDLKIDLTNAVQDFELLAKDWHRFDTSLANQTAESPKTETDVSMAKEKLSMFKARRKEDSERIQRLIEQIAEREAKIIDLEETVIKYEDGSYGLKEAVEEIKFLKGKDRKVDERINLLTVKINDLESQGAELAEDNFALREKLGLPASDLDLTNFKLVKAVQLVFCK